jgi:hypothetical protein
MTKFNRDVEIETRIRIYYRLEKAEWQWLRRGMRAFGANIQDQLGITGVKE